jgi:hypothetical protein
MQVEAADLGHGAFEGGLYFIGRDGLTFAFDLNDKLVAGVDLIAHRLDGCADSFVARANVAQRDVVDEDLHESLPSWL